jgi:hypothetical protein
MELQELLGVLLAPLITALLAVVGFWLKEWYQRRDDDHRRRRTLSDARERVGFISAWLEAHDRVAPQSAQDEVRARAQSDLEQAYAAVARSLIQTAAPGERERIRFRTLAKSLFLLHPFHSGWAKLARVFYYIGLGWAALWIAAGADITVDEDFTPTGVIFAVVMILVFGIAPAWALRSLALWLERRPAR